ncbi:unnamed protein product [Medioppia subpectinata]|uniref:Uncharacterized protein n=1 Tax=Medioppia subpectinata TaxID=1979941 RepID=A0A7R9KWL4_9ACAR|nr:unnamed protein product [Medioppia subpectinata]CAG2111199.1 unnamed protein product [Medioppia subpectinata]
MATGSFIVEMMVSCLMCGRIGVNVGKISAALNTISGSHLSDSEYKELVLFGNALRNPPTVGFTIGGFAAINKSTLISIFTFVLNYTVLLTQSIR